MRKRLKRKVKTEWSSNLAYAIGLLTTDGNLSKDGRHIDLTSKDREQLENFLGCIKRKVKISFKYSGSGRRYPRIQFSDVNFYNFLLSIGLKPKKTMTISIIRVPMKYFFDFLRGHLDGDGSFYSYFDPRWQSSYMFYTNFSSASRIHIVWLRKMLRRLLKINGYISKSINSAVYQLRYAKRESLLLLPKLYPNNRIVCLSRKRLKIQKALAIINKRL